ncbi:MAG: hypothetical protein NVS4B7_05410 [Ktedonobacteraceae bacterium]
MPPRQPTIQPSGSQQTGFYQDATEAISALPNSNPQSFQPGYQQGLPGTPAQGNYAGPGQYGPPMQQPFQAGTYTQHGSYSQVPPFVPGQSYGGYGVQPHLTPPPPKQHINPVLVFASVLLALALVAAIIFSAIYLTREHPAPKVVITPTPISTTAPSPTSMPSPTPTNTPTPTPTPIPSPTAVPTPAPDANFSWCGSVCTANSFMVEFPNGWNQGLTSDKTGVQFLNPTQPDVYANFRVSQAQANSNANELIDTDLQHYYASQSNYVAPTSKSTTAFGKDNWTWTYAIANYQLNGQNERVEVFATIHLDKSYVIELQATEMQFGNVNTQFFATMFNRFQFVQSTS